jgi:hypothetical protein
MYRFFSEFIRSHSEPIGLSTRDACPIFFLNLRLAPPRRRSWQWLRRQPCSSPLNLLYFDNPELELSPPATINHRVSPPLLSRGSKSESPTLLLLPCEALLPLQRFLFFGSIRHSCTVHEIINQNPTSENLKCKDLHAQMTSSSVLEPKNGKSI